MPFLTNKVVLSDPPSTASYTEPISSTASETSSEFYVYDYIPRRCARCRMLKIIEGDKNEWLCKLNKDWEGCRKSYSNKKKR